MADRARRAMAQPQMVLHLRAPQIQKAVLQAHGFRQHLVVHHERRRLRRIENFQTGRQHFNFAAHQVGIDRAGGPLTHPAFDAHDKLIAQTVGDPECFRTVGVADDLHQTFTVAQVDKNNAAVITPPMHPAEQGHGLAKISAVDQPAVIAAHMFNYLIIND